MTDVRAFVEAYLAGIGAGSTALPTGVLSVRWPPTHRSSFGPATLLAFDPGVATLHDAELCVVGSDILDRLVADASGRGFHCIARVERTGDPEPSEVLAANLRFPNAEASVLDASRGRLPYLLFNFRISLASDERREALRSVLINAESLEPHPLSDAYFQESLTVPEERIVATSALEEAYRAACLVLERIVLEDVKAARRESEALLGEELRRIESFYESSIEELRGRRGAAPLEAVRVFLSERDRRVEDARRKHSLSVESRLVNVRTILIPTTMMRVRVHNARAAREVGLEYDGVSLETNRPRCDACGARTATVYLCRAGHLACEESRQGCAFCDDVACSLCRPDLFAQCNACVRPVCPDHAFLDEIGRRPHCPDHIHACAICARMVGPRYVDACTVCGQSYCKVDVDPRSGRCATCRSLALVGPEDGGVQRVLREPGAPRGTSRWWRGENGRYVVVLAEGRVFDHAYALDRNGRLVHRLKARDLAPRERAGR